MKKFGVLFFVLFLVGSVNAVNYYISINGNDANDGLSYNTPIKNITKAVTSARAGDTIYFLAGTYGYEDRMSDDSLIYLSTNVVSGNVTHPITIRSYPGEKVILNATSVGATVKIYNGKSYWIIDGFEIVSGEVYIWGGSVNTYGNSHDIVIKNNNIHDLIAEGGGNPGLIKIDRADSGGAYNIFIWNNTLHKISDVESPGIWDESAVDAAHFGAVTVLSLCSYTTYADGCTGYIEIINNTFFDLPQTFFFKNPMDGPVLIRNNLIYDSPILSFTMAANVYFEHNLVYNVHNGFIYLGLESLRLDPLINELAGSNLSVINNTFVGLSALLGITTGKYHTVKNNVIFGLNGRTSGADYDTRSYFSRRSYSLDTLDSLDPAESTLQTVVSNNNCFITPYADFLTVWRLSPLSIEFYNLSEATEIFGFDLDSYVVIEDDPYVVFVDPDNHDYRLIDSEICGGIEGYYSSGGEIYSPPEEEDCSLTYDTSPCNCLTNIELGNGVNAWFRGELGIGDLMQHLNLWRTNSSC